MSHVAAAVPTPLQEKLLLVDVNHQKINETVVVLESDAGELYAASADLKRWRVRAPPLTEAISYQGQSYFALSSFPGVRQKFDPKALTLALDLPPDAFEDTDRRSQAAALPIPELPTPGGFFNYELFAASAGESQQRSGQFELGVFNAAGVGLLGVFVNDLANKPTTTRLDTTWIHDVPAKRETWRWGDAITSSGTWGQSVRFGGLQYATNFATQPGFATFTPQSIVGQAFMPSTVDIFVNNALVSRQTVPPGPFTVTNLPVVSGSGEVQLVVRDLFGREQVIRQPFYASQALLQKDLHSFAYELGAMRQNFGLQSDSYGAWVASATMRYGQTDQLTTEVHTEASVGQITMGLGGDLLLSRIGTLSSYMAASRKMQDSGVLLMVGIDRLTPAWSFGARTQVTTDGFARVGDADGHAWPSQLSSANTSYQMGALGSVGVALISQIRNNESEARIVSVSYSLGLLGTASLNISALANLRGEQNTRLLATLTLPLDAGLTAEATAQSSRTRNGDSQSDYAASISRNLPSGTGYGYRLQARNAQSVQGSLALQNDTGTYTVDAWQDRDHSAAQFSATGGIAVLAGQVFASRRIDQSFAVATVAGYPGVHVMADNQAVGQTDAQGQALIPRLRAYDRNLISIDQRDLPMDADVAALSLNATPYFRSAVTITFPVKRAFSATFNIKLDDGGALPPGAALTLIGAAGSALLGSEGDIYATNLQARNVLRVDWRGQQCDVLVMYAPTEDPLPDLGTFVCRGIQR